MGELGACRTGSKFREGRPHAFRGGFEADAKASGPRANAGFGVHPRSSSLRLEDIHGCLGGNLLMEHSAINSPALERAYDMMSTELRLLPRLAIDFLNHSRGEAGWSFIKSFAVYAQAVEGKICDEPTYKIQPDHVEWFRKNS